MTKIPLLFIPGYFGSILIERKSKKTRWVRISDFFSNRYDLQMTESYSDLPVKNDLIDHGILKKVSVIPKIIEVESYHQTLVHLKKFCHSHNRDLHTVTYDWRDDFHASIVKIAQKIYDLTKDGQKIDIVAHSNGGILASYFLRYGTQDFFNARESWHGSDLINKLSIVASPLHGTFSLFKHVKDGTPILNNKKLMGSLDYSSFRSTYFFLPHEKLQKGFVHKKGELVRDLSLFQMEEWQKNLWGPYLPHHHMELPVNEKKFQLLLDRAQAFHQLMHQPVYNGPNHKIDIQVVQGLGRPTYFYPTFKSEHGADYHYPKTDRIDGDGVVAHHSSTPLFWFYLHRLQFDSIKAEHLKIVSELKHQKIVHQFLAK